MRSVLAALVIFVIFFIEIEISAGMWKKKFGLGKSSAEEEHARRAVMEAYNLAREEEHRRLLQASQIKIKTGISDEDRIKFAEELNTLPCQDSRPSDSSSSTPRSSPPDQGFPILESYNAQLTYKKLDKIHPSKSRHTYFQAPVGYKASHEGYGHVKLKSNTNLHHSGSESSNPSDVTQFESSDWHKQNQECHYVDSDSSWSQDYAHAALQAHLAEISPENFRAVEYVNQYYAGKGRASGSGSGSVSGSNSHYQQ